MEESEIPVPRVPSARPKMRTGPRKRKTVSIEEALSRGRLTRTRRLQHDEDEVSKEPKAPKSKKKRSENDDESELPPEFRTAGLLANVFIEKGKIYGPFVGEIIKDQHAPSRNHVFICKILDAKNSCEMFFFAEEKDRPKCSWLNMIRSPTDKKSHNFLAYNTSGGACYSAVKDVNVGEELLVLFDADKSGKPSQKGSCKRKTKPPSAFPYSFQEIPSDAAISDEDGTEEEDSRDETYVPEKPIRKASQIKTDDAEAVSDVESTVHNQAAKKRNSTSSRCRWCGITFGTASELKEHQVEDHIAGGVYVKCPVCKKPFSQNYVRDHFKSHDEEALYCNVCTKKFSSPSNLRKHERKHNSTYVPSKREYKKEEPEKCDVCDKMIAGKQALKIHKRIHTGERPHKCDQCNWTFTQGSHLRRHKRNTHGPKKEKKGYKCPVCELTYTSAPILEVHINTVHKGIRPFKCTICTETFTMEGYLWSHERTVHELASPTEEPRKKYLCKEMGCTEEFVLQSELNKHIYEHTGVMPHQCKECQKHFSCSGNLSKHIRRTHRGEKLGPRTVPERKFECPVCLKTYAHQSTLHDHVRVHTEEKISCPHCSQNFVQKSGLRKHLRCARCPVIRQRIVESGGEIPADKYARTKNWQCTKCAKFFAGPSDLAAHDRVHTGEKPFLCDICGKSFTQSGNLAKHKSYIHEGKPRPRDKKREKPFPCADCTKSFKSERELSIHRRVHSGAKPFECPYCGMAFSQKGNVSKHIRRCHTDGGTRASLATFESLGPTRPASHKDPVTGKFTARKINVAAEDFETESVVTDGAKQSVATIIASDCDAASVATSGVSPSQTSSPNITTPTKATTAASATEVLSAIQELVNQYSKQKSQQSNLSPEDAVGLLRQLLTPVRNSTGAQGAAQDSDKTPSDAVQHSSKGSSDSDRNSAAGDFNFPFLQQMSEHPHALAEFENQLAKSSAVLGSLTSSPDKPVWEGGGKFGQTSETQRLIQKLKSHLAGQDESLQTSLGGEEIMEERISTEALKTVTKTAKKSFLVKQKDDQPKAVSSIETDASGKTYTQLQTRGYAEKKQELVSPTQPNKPSVPDQRERQEQGERSHSKAKKKPIKTIPVDESDIQVLTHPDKPASKSITKQKLGHHQSIESKLGLQSTEGKLNQQYTGGKLNQESTAGKLNQHNTGSKLNQQNTGGKLNQQNLGGKLNQQNPGGKLNQQNPGGKLNQQSMSSDHSSSFGSSFYSSGHGIPSLVPKYPFVPSTVSNSQGQPGEFVRPSSSASFPDPHLLSQSSRKQLFPGATSSYPLNTQPSFYSPASNTEVGHGRLTRPSFSPHPVANQPRLAGENPVMNRGMMPGNPIPGGLSPLNCFLDSSFSIVSRRFTDEQ